MTQPRTVTVNTVDHGPVAFTCPPWCVTDHAAVPVGYRVDISHDGQKTPLRFNGQVLGDCLISQAPFAERGTRDIQGFVVVTYGEDRGFDPSGLYDLAACMDSHADQLRDLADQLSRILAGGQQ